MTISTFYMLMTTAQVIVLQDLQFNTFEGTLLFSFSFDLFLSLTSYFC